jgi:hypothetical protein
MARRQTVSALALDEALAKQDEQFVELLRQFHDAKRLATLTDRWARDHRPWARAKIIDYISRPWNIAGHEPVIKRLFKNAEARKDDELMAVFLHRLDTVVRRERRMRREYNWQTREVLEYEALVTPSRADDLFRYRTRYYLRRRVWRYFRRMGFGNPKNFVPAVTRALVLYDDAEGDLKKGEHLLDSWSLMHACFGESAIIYFTPSHTRVVEGQRFADLKPDPVFPKLWQAKDAAESLLGIVTNANARAVRVWAIDLLKRWHRDVLDNVPIDWIMSLLDHPDGEVQQFGAEIFSTSRALGTLPLETWLRLLQTTNITALEMVVLAMEKHVTPERFSLEQLVTIANARPVPVARLGLRLLQSRSIQTKEDRDMVSRLSAARCDGAAGELTRWALSIIGSADHYDPDQVVRFFDSQLLPMRSAAWEWLTESSPGWNDSRLWSRLIETPYDDVRLKLVTALQHRTRAPGVQMSAQAALWCSVLLGIHRGGRVKLTALRQISSALGEHPEDAERLIPVLAVAIRSVRLPEARSGLAAIVTAVDARPELEDVVARFLPELKLNLEKAGAA